MKEGIEKVKNNKLINDEEVKFEHLQSLIILLVKVAGPGMMVITGLILLALRIAGWSLILGLPTTIIGIVLLIYIYDDIITKKIGLEHNHDTTVEEE